MRDEIVVATENLSVGYEQKRRRSAHRPHAAILFFFIMIGFGISTFALLVYLSLTAYHFVAGN
jgi:hypothetical protein